MGFVGQIVGGILGANAAGDASQAEQQGAQQAQQTYEKNQKDATDFQQNVWNGTQQAEQPYQSLGSTSANSLRDLLQKGFQAPTLADVEQTPGFQFQMEQGTNAINENAAATGTLLSGNTGTALEKYGQGLADTTYNDAYQRALSTYMTNYSSLMGGTNEGLSSTGQLGTFGNEASRNISGVDMTSAEGIAKQQNNAAAARASGYLGEAAGWGEMAGGIGAGIGAIAGGIGNLDTTGGSSFGEQVGNFFSGAGG